MDHFAAVRNISSRKYISEMEALEGLEKHLSEYRRCQPQIMLRARSYLQSIGKSKLSLTQSLITHYPLKTEQGYAIMSLAECLDRVPDRETAYQLIDDKIKGMRWNRGDSKSSIVLSAVSQALNMASKMGGNAVTYALLSKAFKELGKEYILGEDIESAVKNAKSLKKDGYLISYDMLGEGARTNLQAEYYLDAYRLAAEKAKNDKESIFENDTISLKLSALHPRYEMLKIEQLRRELMPRIKDIIATAKKRNIAVIIDAEEAARLDLSLLLFSELYLDPTVRYEGLGLAVQAYQKSALYVLEFLRELALEGRTPIPVRLVKGAYWDYEIKKAQADGLDNYPVFTTKDHTDLSYLACAKFMLDSSGSFYPQFATHNVITISSILEVSKGQNYEFQKLYGMGDEVYEVVLPHETTAKCRVYAPVGEQKDLLAYLIRRLLENGANNSFINQLALARDDIDKVLRMPFVASASSIKLPSQIYPGRKNSFGFDISSYYQVNDLAAKINLDADIQFEKATEQQCDYAVDIAVRAFDSWNELGANERANIIERVADKLEENVYQLAGILISEAKRNIADSLSEVREAVDFCRYYAMQARASMMPRKMSGITGEDNFYQLEGRGVFVCISPWNFPLAIFTGQIVAGLVAGNSIIAKPADQTPKVAAYTVNLMHAAGVPKEVLQLVIGRGSVVGNRLVSNPHIAGVCFTGSTETARLINKTLAANNPRIVPFIAETGGQNCMIVDSTALIERTVDDMIISAFGSAGQRCSALRVAYVHDSIADELIQTLKGAMAEIEVSSTTNFSSDVGEVIDANAKSTLEKHIERMNNEAKLLALVNTKAEGNFVPPHLFEINSIKQLPTEVFGPVLHLIRYTDFEKVIEEINSTGYGLTFGIQTRIGHRVNYLGNKIKAGNIYANRSMIGAVVESQAFGGHGLSGTGPKAGGPEYLKRFCVEKVVTINKTAIGGNLELL